MHSGRGQTCRSVSRPRTGRREGARFFTGDPAEFRPSARARLENGGIQKTRFHPPPPPPSNRSTRGKRRTDVLPAFPREASAVERYVKIQRRVDDAWVTEKNSPRRGVGRGPSGDNANDICLGTCRCHGLSTLSRTHVKSRLIPFVTETLRNVHFYCGALVFN